MKPTKKIWFEQTDTENPIPVQFEPCVNHIPNWYKKIDPYKGNKPQTYEGSVNNATLKRCAPVYDALTFGYMAILHCDLVFNISELENNEVDLSYNYASEPTPIQVREYNPEYSMELDNTYLPIEFTWQQRWSINTEPNSSILVTHPLNRFDLPFTTTSGVVDTDSGFMVDVGSVPFYIKKGFNGVIPCGTPMFQIIPFERQKYKHEIREVSQTDKFRRKHKWQKYFTSGYRKAYRSTKSFN